MSFPSIDDLPTTFTERDELLDFVRKIKKMKRYKKFQWRLGEGFKINREKLINAHLFMNATYDEELGIVPVIDETSYFNIEDREGGEWSIEFEEDPLVIKNEEYNVKMKLLVPILF